MDTEKEYKCIKEFAVPKYDQDEELIEGENFTIPVDSIWELQDHAYMSEIRLEGNFGWLEISLENLKENFVEIN